VTTGCVSCTSSRVPLCGNQFTDGRTLVAIDGRSPGPAATNSLAGEIPANDRSRSRVVKHRSDIQRAEPTGPHHGETVHCFSRICFNDCNASAVRQVMPTADLPEAMGLLYCSIVISGHSTEGSEGIHLLLVVDFEFDHEQHDTLLVFCQGRFSAALIS
jgi:hypothetical protein